MKIALLAPIETSSVVELLGNPSQPLPRGYPGAPLFGILATALVNCGHEVQAFTTDSSLYRSGNQPMVISGPRFALHYIPSRPRSFRPERGRLGRMLDLFAYERKGLIKALKGFDPDVIHAHWTYEFAWAALDSSAPCVITAHDSPWDVLLHTKDLYRAGRYMMARNVMRRATNLTAVSPIISTRLAKMTNAPICVVPNPIPDSMFTAHCQKRSADPGAVKIVMIINGWSDLKNPEPALAAFALLKKRNPGWQLHCYGADFGPGERAFQWLIQNTSLEGVHLHGRRPYSEVLEGLSTADVLVHPSRTEACSMAIAEAMSLGVPVIGGNASGGVPWQLDYGKAGFLTDIESPQAIADTVQSCIDTIASGADIRSHIVNRARALFSASRVVSLYETEYLKALGKEAAPSSSRVVP